MYSKDIEQAKAKLNFSGQCFVHLDERKQRTRQVVKNSSKPFVR
jgi:hypothetical protein